MNFFQSVNFKRLATVLALAAIAIVAKKYGGPELDNIATLAAVALAGALKSFLEPGDNGPSVPVLPCFLLCFLACGALTPKDHADLANHAAKLAECRNEGHADGGYAAYEKCKSREGLNK